MAGLEEAIQLFESLAPVFQAEMSRMVRYAFVNGLPGFVTVEPGGVVQTTALDLADGRIAGIYVVRNPEKVRHLGSMESL